MARRAGRDRSQRGALPARQAVWPAVGEIGVPALPPSGRSRFTGSVSFAEQQVRSHPEMRGRRSSEDIADPPALGREIGTMANRTGFGRRSRSALRRAEQAGVMLRTLVLPAPDGPTRAAIRALELKATAIVDRRAPPGLQLKGRGGPCGARPPCQCLRDDQRAERSRIERMATDDNGLGARHLRERHRWRAARCGSRPECWRRR